MPPRTRTAPIRMRKSKRFISSSRKFRLIDFNRTDAGINGDFGTVGRQGIIAGLVDSSVQAREAVLIDIDRGESALDPDSGGHARWNMQLERSCTGVDVD